MNKYEQIKVLGQGGFGKAILAKNRSDGKLFVIKEVRLTALGPKERADAMKEVKVLASLHHPYIVDYTESFQERGCLFIVMSYADGGDLSQKIEKAGRTPISEEEVLKYFIQMALAIKYVHDRKIVHRDLKGQNVFLMKNGDVRLGDFGIAIVLEHTFQFHRTQIGTPFYMSPEICKGLNYSFKTDIWSLGCIAYELCTLRHAFEGGNMNALFGNIIRGRYSPISGNYSQGLKDLIYKTLTPEPEKRPTINDILQVPFIRERLSKYLDQTLLDYEMQHTILHGRKPLAEPTMIAPRPQKQESPAAAPLPPANPNATQEQRRQNELRAQQKALMAEAERKKKEYEEKQRQLDIQRRQLAQQEAAQREKDAQLRAKEVQMQKEAEERVRNQAYQDRQQALNNNRDRGRGCNLNLGWDYDSGPSPKERAAQRRKQQDEDAEAQRRQIFMEQKRAAQANKQRCRDDLFNGGDHFAHYNDEPASPPPQRRDRQQQNQIDDAERRRLFMEQQNEARANRAKMKEEMAGGGVMAAMRDAYPDNDDGDRPRQQQRKGQQQDQEAINAYMREQRHIAQENKRRLQQAELGGGDAAAAMRDPEADYARDIPKRDKKPNQDEINAYMREQRHIAQENKRRLLQAEMGGGDAAAAMRDPEADYARDIPQKKKEMDLDEINAYMREQRHIARANKERLQRAELGGGDAAAAMRDPDADYARDIPQKKKEMDLDEINAYMREQRHIARANKERLQHAELGGGDAAAAMRDPEADYARDIPQKKKEMDLDEINAYMREQRHIARANKERLLRDELGGGDAAAAMRDPDADYARDIPQKKKEMDLNEINAYMREQRHIARANKEKAQKAEYGGEAAASNLEGMSPDELNAYMEKKRAAARGQQQHNDRPPESAAEALYYDADDDDDEPLPQKEKQPERSLQEINAYMREQRHARRANAAKAKAEMAGMSLEEMVAEEERKMRQQQKAGGGGSPQKSEPTQADLEKMSPEELDAYMAKKRAAVKDDANKHKPQQQAEDQNDEDDDYEPPPQKEKQPERSLQEINDFMREQRHARRANAAKAKAEMAGMNENEWHEPSGVMCRNGRNDEKEKHLSLEEMDSMENVNHCTSNGNSKFLSI